MATAPLSMAIQGYAQAALVSFPQDSHWIQPSDSDLNNAYWNAVKGQCPKDVQVWPARDAQGILHLYSFPLISFVKGRGDEVERGYEVVGTHAIRIYT